jgi:hypothetical protein
MLWKVAFGRLNCLVKLFRMRAGRISIGVGEGFLDAGFYGVCFGSQMERFRDGSEETKYDDSCWESIGS